MKHEANDVRMSQVEDRRKFVIRASRFLRIRHSSCDIRFIYRYLTSCTESAGYPASVTDSLFGGLGVKRFSHFLIEGVAFAFGCEPFVFRLNIGFAFL